MATMAALPASQPITRPITYFVRMVLFLIAVGIVIALLSPALIVAYHHNPLLNTLIILILLLGIAWNFHQVLRLAPEVTWLETFRHNRLRAVQLKAPRMLAPMANMLAARAQAKKDGSERFTLSAPAMRSLLDSIASRLDESRELSRYMIGLLIFLGLLGTFWGLLKTVNAVSEVIAGMSIGTGDINALFEQLKSGLVRPLAGMGTAFSASMFGLAGALILGFLDLTAGQAQNRFFNELEEWLASLTRLSSGVLGGESEGSVPIYVQALLEQTAENMETLQHTLARGEEGRMAANHAVISLTEKIAMLTDSMRANHQLMLHIAEAQTTIGPALQKLSERANDDTLRTHMRNVEILLQRMVTESEQGRTQATAELRSDLRVLTRTIAAIAEEAQS